MGVAYSPPDKVVHADIDASSSHCLRQGLHRAVLKAGWEIVRTVTDGYVYLLTSPQDPILQSKVRIQDTGKPALVDIVFMDVEEEHLSGAYVIRWDPSFRLRAHITPCQIFTYMAGVTGNAVMGGIPFVDPNALESTADGCADEDNDLKTTRAWWSSSDLSTGDYFWGVPCFRTSWNTGCSATLHNNDFVSETGPFIGDACRLRITILQKPEYFQGAYGSVNFAYPLLLRWTGTEEPLSLDPFLAWNSAHPLKIRGQVWDAFYRTKFAEWESPLTFDALNWFSYSTGDRTMSGTSPFIYSPGDLFTLYLRDPGLTYFECDEEEPEPPAESNYAY